MEYSSVNGEALLRRLAGKFSTDTLRYVPAAVVPAVLSIVGVGIFTRLFDPLHYGRYALVVSATVLTSSFLSGWIQQSVLRYLPKYRADRSVSEFCTKLFFVLAALSLAILIASSLVYAIVRKSLGEYHIFYFPAVALVIAEVVFLSLISLFQADLRSRDYSLYRISSAALRLSFALVFVLFVKRDVVGLILGAAAAYFVLAVPMVRGLTFERGSRWLRSGVDPGFLRMLAGYGLPMIGWMLCGQVLGLSDRFIIGAFRGSTEVGIYSANYNLVNLGFALLSGPMLTAAHPIIIGAWEAGRRDEIPAIVSGFSRYYLLAVVPLAFLVAVLSRDIVSIVLGERFQEGFVIIPFVLAGVFVWGLSMYGHKGLEILERTRLMLLLVAVSALANVVLNFLFVPKFGYRAAAVTTFVSYVIYPLLVYRAARPLIPWRIPWRSVGRILLAAVLSGGVVFLVRQILAGWAHPFLTIFVGTGIGLPAYVGFLLLLREVRSSEIKVVVSMSGRRRAPGIETDDFPSR